MSIARVGVQQRLKLVCEGYNLREAFEEAVEDYLETCKKLGKIPHEKPPRKK